MKCERERAWAKLNLSLNVLDPLPDGYHGMEMVMQSCSLCDELRVCLTTDGSFLAHSNLYFLPCDDRNITVKAARRFFEIIGETRLGVRVDMKKRVPVCAGLGGGSSDAAAVLRALNRLTRANMSAQKLREIGLSLGADVPFCITGGTYFAENKGELLQRIPALPSCGLVICKPRFSISTAALFAQIDTREKRDEPDAQGMIKALENADITGVASKMRNVFEDVLTEKHAEIFEIKKRLLSLGAIGSLMSGTGSAVFGIFENARVAQKAQKELSAQYRECFFAEPTAEIVDV